MMGFLIGIIVTVVVAYLIIKKYKAQTVLLLGGLVLMSCTLILGIKPSILSAKVSTGFVWFDMFEFLKITFSSRAAGLGLIIMAVAGFAKYMDHIGASGALVRLTVKPLAKMHAPYIVLAVGYVLGQLLNVFIPSASGLGVLLMVTMFPILINLGVSRLAGTAMIGTAACLDLGPASGNAVLAAKTANMDVAIYFAQYQIPVAIVVILTIAVLHYFVQKWFDEKAGHIVVKKQVNAETSDTIDEKVNAPMIYVLLPIFPLILILVFSKLLISSIKMNVITAMLMGVFLSMVFEYVRHKDAKKVFASIQIFFDGMGSQFAKVVTLVVAGEAFAQGLMSIGAIDYLINSAQSAGFGVSLMILVMTGIISVSAVVMGSGNAPFFAFASLAPGVATQMGINAVLLLLPMQFAAGIARSVSPITAVIVAVSGVADVSPIDVVKRTAIPMAGGLIASIIANFIFF